MASRLLVLGVLAFVLLLAGAAFAELTRTASTAQAGATVANNITDTSGQKAQNRSTALSTALERVVETIVAPVSKETPSATNRSSEAMPAQIIFNASGENEMESVNVPADSFEGAINLEDAAAISYGADGQTVPYYVKVSLGLYTWDAGAYDTWGAGYVDGAQYSPAGTSGASVKSVELRFAGYDEALGAFDRIRALRAHGAGTKGMLFFASQDCDTTYQSIYEKTFISCHIEQSSSGEYMLTEIYPGT